MNDDQVPLVSSDLSAVVDDEKERLANTVSSKEVVVPEPENNLDDKITTLNLNCIIKYLKIPF